MLIQPLQNLLALPFAAEEQIFFVGLERPQSGKRMDGGLGRHHVLVVAAALILCRNGSRAAAENVSPLRKTSASKVSRSLL